MNYLDFYSKQVKSSHFGAVNPFKDPVFGVLSIGALGMLFMVVQHAREKAAGSMNIELTKPNGASWTVKNLQEFMTELLAASPGWREMGQQMDISTLFSHMFGAGGRTEGIITTPKGAKLFSWKKVV